MMRTEQIPQLIDMLARLYSKLELVHDQNLDMQSKMQLDDARKIMREIAAIIRSGGPTGTTVGSSAALGTQQPRASTEPPIAESMQPTIQSNSNIRILIVDDDEDVHRMLGFALKKKGFEVVSRTNPEEALAQLAQISPKLILLDLMMPQMSGFEFLQRVNSHPLRNSFRIAIGSSRSYDKDRVGVLEAGANDFIAKPYNLAELVVRLRNLAA